MAEILALQDIAIHYDTKKILTDVSFQLESGAILGLIGPSGCGKSSLFQLILGKIKASHGSLKRPAGAIAYVPQNDVLLSWRTVLGNLLLPFELNVMQASPEAKALCYAMLARLDLSNISHCYPDQLSGGMKKRVALMRAFLTQSDLLLLDEPFTGLDDFTKLGLYQVLHQLLQYSAKAVVLITHDLREAALWADDVVLLGAPLGQTTRIIHRTKIIRQHLRQFDANNIVSSDQIMDYQTQWLSIFQAIKQ